MREITDKDLNWSRIMAWRIANRYRMKFNDDVISSAYEGLVIASKEYDGRSDWLLFAFYKVRDAILYEIRRVYGDARNKRGKAFREAKHQHFESFLQLNDYKILSTNGTEKKIINKDMMRKLLLALTKREANVLQEVYCNDLTLAETARKLKTSESRICVVRRRALRKAKKHAMSLGEEIKITGNYDVNGNSLSRGLNRFGLKNRKLSR